MILCLLLGLIAATQAPAAPDRRDECQYLAGRFEWDGFSSDTTARDGSFDGVGNAFAANALPAGDRLVVRSSRFGTVEFLRPPTDGLKPNMVPCKGQVIAIRTKRIFNVLFALGSAHHGIHSGWIEFRFEDGTTGLGPFGFTDWAWEPALGEEVAFLLPPSGDVRPRSGTGMRLWLQRTPIPSEKRIVAIRLPFLPNAKIVALTLGWRDGVRPIEPPKPTMPDPGPVAIFSEPGFPYFFVRADLTPSRIRAALANAGIGAALLGIDHLKDPTIFRVDAYPVLVNPYGNTFPADAEENLRAFRKAGGSMVHLAVPFTHPVVRTAYGSFWDRDHTGDLLGHTGDRALGAGGFVDAAWRELAAEPALAAWGLGDVEWDRFLPRGADLDPHIGYAVPQALDRQSLDPGDEVTPLLSLAAFDRGPYAAIIRHRSCAFAGAIDVWAGAICLGLQPLDVPVAAATEFIVRGAARILHEKGVIDVAKWEAIARPVAEALRRPEAIEPVLPDPSWSWRLPEAAPVGKQVLRVDVRDLPAAERILAASAQGLINRTGGPLSVFLVDGDAAEKRLEGYRSRGFVEETRPGGLDQVFDRLGHRRAVVVDPDVRGSLNVATMIAAAEGLLIGYPALVEPNGLEIAEDLRGRFVSGVEGYEWARENLLPRLSPRLLAMVEPDPKAYAIRDYLIAQKVFTFWISSDAEQSQPGASKHREAAFASKFLARTPVCIPVIGPLLDPNGAQLLSRFGKYLLDLASLRNLSFTSGLRVKIEAAPRAEIHPPPLAFDKVYVACVAREQGQVQTIHSGTLPEWPPGVSPAAGRLLDACAVDLLPVEAARILGSLGPRECLGSPGLGVAMPEVYGSAFGDRTGEVRTNYRQQTDRSMKDLGQRFLVLKYYQWRTPKEGEIADCARIVRAAEIILPSLRRDSGLTPASACYLQEATPVVHALVNSFTELSPDRFGEGPYAAGRPAFAWVPVPLLASQFLSQPVFSDVVLVNPLELAALYKQYAAER